MADLGDTNSQSPRFRYFPQKPMSLQELEIPESVVADILLRRVHRDGISSLQSLSQSLKLSFSIVSGVFQKLRSQQLFDISGLEGNNYFFSLTNAGRELAENRLRLSRYSGPAPVSLEAYSSAVKAQAGQLQINGTKLRKALFDLVLPDRFLDQLGPALVSQNSVFLYGPTGNGKTSVAIRIPRVYNDLVFIPYAVEYDGQIILIHDPSVHREIEVRAANLDPRWVLCERPCIAVGGELDLSMLELRYDDTSGTYVAPPQMKANNGVFIIDDFGRQMITPQHLLNRWIIPLDRNIDYLTLSHGRKFQTPFKIMVVFATNMQPRELGDEAFLRRIRNKVYVGAVEDGDFDGIFRRLLSERKLPFDPDIFETLRSLCRENSRREDLSACYPIDILNIVISISKYEEQPVQINREILKRAASIYFSRT